jgi:lauroyl/myristoyl acyltransferase
MERFLNDAPGGTSWKALATANHLVRTQGYWARARGFHGRGWAADLEVLGREHLDRAVQGGSGAVLWRMDFCGSHIATQALHRLGFPLVHVSRPEHGMPHDDPIGRRIVAPLYRRAETRYLAERVEIGTDGSLDYLRVLMARLRANGIVSIMGEFPGRAGVTTTVRGVEMEFATGAPSLARTAGAELLTMYSHRLAYDRYRVIIEEPISATGPGRAGGNEAAVAEFATRLERAITAHPESWMRWREMR